MGEACYDMLVSTGTFTTGTWGWMPPRASGTASARGTFDLHVHRDVWDDGGFGMGLQALSETKVAEVRSREAGRLFADDAEPSGWYLVVEKISS